MSSSLGALQRAARTHVRRTSRAGIRLQGSNNTSRVSFFHRRWYHEHVLRLERDSLVMHPFNRSSVDRNVSVDVPQMWLRDNCRCTSCVNQDTMQRNYDTFSLPDQLSIEKFSTDNEGINVKWSDQHESKYAWSWLEDATQTRRTSKIEQGAEHWTAQQVAQNPPMVSYQAVMSGSDPSGMAALTKELKRRGFCFIDETPKTPEATQAVLEKIGPIRNTHYGGFYDFIPDLALADTAYTNLPLAPHTDTTYFSEPAGLQAFHLLSHTPAPGQEDSEGGQSVLVDGFTVASQVDQETSAILEKIRVPWHASGNDGIAIVPDQNYPVIERFGKQEGAQAGELRRIRWNNDDRGTVPVAEADEWYQAARKFSALVSKKENQYWFQLVPGRMLIFDNWRVMHGRSGFEGLRRMCGAYIPRDDFISRWKTSNYEREDVIAHNLGQR